jgi:hypothetical protein
MATDYAQRLALIGNELRSTFSVHPETRNGEEARL